MIYKRLIITALSLIAITSCSLFERQDGAPKGSINPSEVDDAIVKPEPLSPYGNPASYEQSGVNYRVMTSAKGYKARGVASWYGTKFHGERTSSGEVFDMFLPTAAHTTLPLPTYVRVTNLANQKQIIVKVNDRGPFKKGRLIDLSYAAAVKLGYHLQGTAEVEVEAIVPEGMHRVVSPSEAPSGKQIFVQVAALSDRTKARKLRDAIGPEVPWPVVMSKVNVQRRSIFRVRVGPIAELADANQLIEMLTMPDLGTPRVVFE